MRRHDGGWLGTWVDQHGLEVLDRDRARDLLASVPYGRLAFCRGTKPTVLPVNHVVDSWEVAFRSSYGAKLQEAAAGHPVSFQADDFRPGVGGWSVLVHGQMRIVRDPAMLRRLKARELETPVLGARLGRWVAVRIDEISGRRLRLEDAARS